MKKNQGKRLLDGQEGAWSDFCELVEKLKRERKMPTALDLARWLAETANAKLVTTIYQKLGDDYALAIYLMTVYKENQGGV